MVKRIDDLGNVKGTKPTEQSKRTSKKEPSISEPISSRSAQLLTKAAEKLFPGLSPSARDFLVDSALNLKKGPKGIGRG